jgi:hypothetical protein
MMARSLLRSIPIIFADWIKPFEKVTSTCSASWTTCALVTIRPCRHKQTLSLFQLAPSLLYCW